MPAPAQHPEPAASIGWNDNQHLTPGNHIYQVPVKVDLLQFLRVRAALAQSPATEAIMGAVPSEKGGIASAVKGSIPRGLLVV
jgi:hypothetical protein